VHRALNIDPCRLLNINILIQLFEFVDTLGLELTRAWFFMVIL